MLARLRPWHWIVVALSAALALLLLWFALAYGGLPRLWSHHEHKWLGRRDEIVSYTSQDIPGDPINLRVRGSPDQIRCAFEQAGWQASDPVSLRSALGIAESVILHRSYPSAPVSPLYVGDKVQDLAFERQEGVSADERHHVRFWRIGPRDWLAAATYDRGVGLSLFTLQITHHIGADVDAERALSGRIIMESGGHRTADLSSHLPPGIWHRNGGGDRYRTDGIIHTYELGYRCATR